MSHLEQIRFGHRFTFNWEGISQAALFQAASWRLMSEMAMRWPGEFEASSDSYPTGSPMYWLRHKSLDMRIGIVSGASITVFNPKHKSRCPVCDSLPEEENSRFHTLDAVFSGDIAAMVDDLAICAGLGGSIPNRRHSRMSVSFSLLRDLVWQLARGDKIRGIDTMNNLYSGGHERSELLSRFPSLRDLSSAVRQMEDGDSRFQEELEDQLRDLVFVQFIGELGSEESLILSLSKGMVHEVHGAWQLMDEVDAGATTLEIAKGLVE